MSVLLPGVVGESNTREDVRNTHDHNDDAKSLPKSSRRDEDCTPSVTEDNKMAVRASCEVERCIIFAKHSGICFVNCGPPTEGKLTVRIQQMCFLLASLHDQLVAKR